MIAIFSIIIQFVLIFVVMFFATFTVYELLSSGLIKRRNKISETREIYSKEKLSEKCNISSADDNTKLSSDVSINLSFGVANTEFTKVCTTNINTKINSESEYSSYSSNTTNKEVCSILLPICNEISVVEQLITSIYEIEVPRNSVVEILLLDDSSEENSRIIKNIFDRFVSQHSLVSDDITVSDLQKQNFNKKEESLEQNNKLKSKSISYYRRTDAERVGFKAGNISYGLGFAKGDFIVIFDADNIPPKNFLTKTMPHFADKKVGFLQTAIEFRNRKQNFITRFLALETSHKDDITSNQSNSNNANLNSLNNISDSVNLSELNANIAKNEYLTEQLNTNSHNDSLYLNKSEIQNDYRNEYQDFASLTGSSCIWRKTCLDEIGGFSSETLTEDIDLCYRAQLHGWKYVYAENVVSSEELPSYISGLRVQRHRWAYGLIRNAFLHTSKVLFAKDFSFVKKFKAFMLISQTFLLASFVVLLLLSLPLVFVTKELGLTFNISCTIFLLTTVIWGYNNLSTGKNRIDHQISNDNKNTNTDNQENHDANKDMPILFFEYLGYIFMYIPLSLYYFIALVENVFGIKTSFIPTEKLGMTDTTNNNCKVQHQVKNSKINNVLYIFEVICFCYALVVSILSIYLENWWTLLYGFICFSGFLLVLCLSTIEHYIKLKK